MYLKPEGNGTPLQYSCLENPWMEEPGRLKSMASPRVGHDWATSLSPVGEGNGNPLQCSCLENPRDREAWWAAVYGVAQSQTRLKWLSSSMYPKSSHHREKCILKNLFNVLSTWGDCCYSAVKSCPALFELLDCSMPGSSLLCCFL